MFENVDDGLLVPTGQNATVLSEVQVDGQGFIFVPYAGRIRAAGNSPEAIRGAITRQLESQTPDPQVQVFRVAGDGSTVSVTGEVGAPGVYPIEPGTRTLSAMLARAGGPAHRHRHRRGDAGARRHRAARSASRTSTTIPSADIALRPGDRVIIESDDRSFTALGATGTQTQVPFDDSADLGHRGARERRRPVARSPPTRPASSCSATSPRPSPSSSWAATTSPGTQRVVYVLDLTRPNGMFFARDFAIRDGDTVYVTEAPFVQFNKVIASITGTLGLGRTPASARWPAPFE